MVTAFTFDYCHSPQQWKRAWEYLYREQPLLRTSFQPDTLSFICEVPPICCPTLHWKEIGRNFTLQEGVDYCLENCDFGRLRLNMFSSSTAEHAIITAPHALLGAPAVIALVSRLLKLLQTEDEPVWHIDQLVLPPSIYQVLNVDAHSCDLRSWLESAAKVSADTCHLLLTLQAKPRS